MAHPAAYKEGQRRRNIQQERVLIRMSFPADLSN
jgi:hypothetical protein